jgi:aryl sulfotransferase
MCGAAAAKVVPRPCDPQSRRAFSRASRSPEMGRIRQNKTHDVLNHHQDSTQWDVITFREGDIVAANWAKAGITWLQQIILQLLHDGREDVAVNQTVVWPDWWSIPKEQLKAWTDQLPGRRVFKTHLPADALNLSGLVRYIYIARDPRDVVWSLHPHLLNYAQGLVDGINAAPHRDWVEDWDRPTTDIRKFYNDWLDGDGAPYWPFWSNVQSWWDVRELPNVMLVHHQELKTDLEGGIRRIAAFLELDPSPLVWPAILEHCSFDWMKANKDRLLPVDSFIDKGASFMNRGVNGRWRDVLSREEIARADAFAGRNLSLDCARWLMNGASG